MKTMTYLRLCLLIPFLVWASCALALFLWSTFEPDGLGSERLTAIGVIAIFFLFYVFGILVWFLPYLLVCIILLVWSFKSRAQVLMKAFALSPFGMTFLVLAFVNMLALNGEDMRGLVSNPGAFAEDLFGSNVLFLILTLLWGISVSVSGMARIGFCSGSNSFMTTQFAARCRWLSLYDRR